MQQEWHVFNCKTPWRTGNEILHQSINQSNQSINQSIGVMDLPLKTGFRAYTSPQCKSLSTVFPQGVVISYIYILDIFLHLDVWVPSMKCPQRPPITLRLWQSNRSIGNRLKNFESLRTKRHFVRRSAKTHILPPCRWQLIF